MSNTLKGKREALPEISGFEIWLAENKGNYALSNVASVVCEALRVDISHLRARDKPQWITDARQIYCYMARNLTRASYNEIAMRICRMHPSVISAERNITDKIAIQDEKIVEKVGMVYQYFKQSHSRARNAEA